MLVKYTVIEIDCDECGIVDRVDYMTNYSLSKFAKEERKLGWTIGKKCICPDCRKKEK